MEFGGGFGKRNLHHMIRFAEVFPEPEIVHALRTQLSWTHRQAAGRRHRAEFAERDFEAAILRDLEAFPLELGQGFRLVAREKRMSIGPDDFYLDLLFFLRGVRGQRAEG